MNSETTITDPGHGYAGANSDYVAQSAEAAKKGFAAGTKVALDSLNRVLDCGVETGNLDRPTADFIMAQTGVGILVTLKAAVAAQGSKA